MTLFSKARYSDTSCITRLSNPRVAGSSPAAPTSTKKPVKNEQLAHKVKLQSSDFYLKPATANQYGKVSALPPTKENWAEYERLRLLAWRLRRNSGFSWWVPVLFATLAVAIFLLWLILSEPKAYFYVAPQTAWRVLEKISDSEFVMQRVEMGAPQVPEVKHFCSDYSPRFLPGMTLQWFSYEDRGDCISIAQKSLGYVIMRGADHWPLLPPNCHHSATGPRCIGKPKFD